MSSSPRRDPAFAMPAAAWAARSGDPVLFANAIGCRPRPRRRSSGTQRSRSSCSGPPRGSPRTSSARSPRSTSGCGGFRARTRSPTRSPSPATQAETSAGTSTTRATASSSPARTRRSMPSPAAPLSASGTWGPLLLSDSADTLPAALRDYLLDVKPGYTTDPTRAFYNHVWVIGDRDAIDVAQQAEIDELAELAKIGGETVSEAENPNLLAQDARGHRRGHTRPGRCLHPPLRPPGPQPDPPPDRAAARRPSGAARRRAQDRRARGARRAQRRSARDARNRTPMKNLAAGFRGRRPG